jgi:hypothetical protein
LKGMVVGRQEGPLKAPASTRLASDRLFPTKALSPGPLGRSRARRSLALPMQGGSHHKGRNRLRQEFMGAHKGRQQQLGRSVSQPTARHCRRCSRWTEVVNHGLHRVEGGRKPFVFRCVVELSSFYHQDLKRKGWGKRKRRRQQQRTKSQNTKKRRSIDRCGIRPRSSALNRPLRYHPIPITFYGFPLS